MLEFLLYKAPKTTDGIIYHNYIENMIWVDAFYMVPPFLAAAGYPQEAVKQIDGLFHDILDDPSTFAETNSAQMFAYAIFRGVKGGWLDKSYLTFGLKMRKAAFGKVDSFGLVQGVCGAPNFNKAGTATEGQAF